MTTTRKTEQLCIRFTAEQLRRLKRAAGILGKERGEVPEVSSLFRELGMEQVGWILAGKGKPARVAPPSTPSAPAADTPMPVQPLNASE